MNFILLASFAETVPAFRGGLLNSLRDAGLSVHLAAPLDDRGVLADWALKNQIEVHDIELERTGLNPWADLMLFGQLLLLFRRLRPSMTLPYTVKPVIYGTIAAWLSGVPHRYALVTGLGYAFTESRAGFLPLLVRSLYSFALSRAHKVFFQNRDDEFLFRRLGILPARVPSVVVNGSGVDVAAYPSAFVGLGCPIFLMIARLLGDKGLREYAQAARRIRAAHPKARFRLVGWVDTNPDAIAQSELNAWIADGTLEFLGKLDDVRPAIADATVYVLPSYREGTPRTVLEAMAMGRAIITTDAPGCRETVIDGENGFLVPVKSVDALVEAMLRFIEDPTLAPRMGMRSREIAEDKYDVHKVNAVMLREMGIAPPQDENADAA